MAARALILTGDDRRRDFVRWSLAAALVLAAHFGLVATYFLLPKAGPQGAPPAPAVIIDLAPMPVAPASQLDITPGPQQVDSVQAEPEPQQQQQQPRVEPQIEPPPQVETPAEVVLPEPQKQPLETKPVETKPVETKPVEAKPVEKPPEPKKERQQNSRATATPRSESRTADRPAAPSPGSQASQAALASWRDQVRARLAGVKNCPSGAGSGTVGVTFTLNRGGGVVGRSIYRSSGNSALDQEALAMVGRAAPFPPVPAGQPTPVQVPVPVNFTCR